MSISIHKKMLNWDKHNFFSLEPSNVTVTDEFSENFSKFIFSR